jgi:hypothetical protein
MYNNTKVHRLCYPDSVSDLEGCCTKTVDKLHMRQPWTKRVAQTLLCKQRFTCSNA